VKILVTGSRDFNDYGAVARALTVAIDELKYRFPDDKRIIVMHGAARGADALAKEFVNKTERTFRSHGYTIQEVGYPARWNKHGKQAGPIRNALMVGKMPDLVLAFFLRGATNYGTTDCHTKAKIAGLETKVIWGDLLPESKPIVRIGL